MKVDIVTVFQHFILSQNFLAELYHERINQDKICEEGRGDKTFFNFPRKILDIQYHQIGAM